jgi:hypothetical protein
MNKPNQSTKSTANIIKEVEKERSRKVEGATFKQTPINISEKNIPISVIRQSKDINHN